MTTTASIIVMFSIFGLIYLIMWNIYDKKNVGEAFVVLGILSITGFLAVVFNNFIAELSFFGKIILCFILLVVVALFAVGSSIEYKERTKAKNRERKQIQADADEKRRKKIADAVRKENQKKIADADEKRRKKREEAAQKEHIKQVNLQQQYDADVQHYPVVYSIGRHGNQSLAIRYGIANVDNKRNNQKESVQYQGSGKIRLQKTSKIREDLYNVMLTDFGNRPAVAVIEIGTRVVKTFYPLDQDKWFEEQKDLELTLKNNHSFTIKELATFHVNRTLLKKEDRE